MTLNFRKTGTGKPLVILHGLFGSADNWMSIAKGLEENFTLYLLDQRNHGDSPHSDTWNYKAMAEDLKEFMEAEGLQKASFLGHSMGGKTVMKFALTYPEMVDKLVVADIAPRPYPVHHQTILEALNAVDIKSLASRKEAEDKLAEYIPERGIRQFLLKNLTRKEGVFAWKVNLPIITKQIENVGEKITADKPFSGPALFMGGANSDYIKSSDKEEIAALFPDHHIIHIKNTGHWLHAEQPEAVIATLKTFLGT
ncbi:alpha/beta fold hydrolase [Cyclobacterium qasimii]|uniref:Alpha/beta hydrolase n=2 Tax=Cyclobacterium qasimii TaxID=1350429 RepID=A0A512CA55_9BACT|nr:alpha/beta fold hydrolase [Cyclobacterium qasimii]EPR66314.1 putative esterase/lipase ybfF [Cyclobacterium qasimii M12-11B]GEO21050.1 alpha/beta hydrolase [Cyclobacterium qasimii]